MPILTPCAEPGCSAFIAPGDRRCPKHQRTIDRRRGSAIDRGYDYAWTQRAALFRQRYPLCGDRPDGRVPVYSKCWESSPRLLTPADLVDHVVPHRNDRNLFWDERGNWQSLCRSCHALKTAAGL